MFPVKTDIKECCFFITSNGLMQCSGHGSRPQNTWLALICIDMESWTGEGSECLCTALNVEASRLEALCKGTRDVEAGSRLLRTGSTFTRIQVPAEQQRRPTSGIRRIRLRPVVKPVLSHSHFLKRAKQQITRHPAHALTFWLAVT